MTPPIRVRRLWYPTPGNPRRWSWFCRRHLPGDPTSGGLARTQPAARDAGLAHLVTHTETR